jgi:hypothetical protein
MERTAHLKRTVGKNDDPDRFLYVYAVAADDANDVKTVLNAGFLDLGMLKGNRGIRATTCRIASTRRNIG